MKLLLGEVYLTGGPKGQRTLTIPFWNEDARGESFRYVKVSLKADMTDAAVEDAFEKAMKEMKELKNKTWVDGKGWK